MAGIHYEWQFNGTNIAGATNSTLALSSVQATNEGSYRVVVSTGAGSVTSAVATFTLVRTPQIVSVTPSVPGFIWVTSSTNLTVVVTAAGTNLYPIHYQWKRNGTVNTNQLSAGYPLNAGLQASSLDGDYSVIVTNAAGSTNIGTWQVQAFYSGMVAAWDAESHDLLSRPSELTNTLSIATGPIHSLAVSEEGTVSAWGGNSSGQTNVPSGLTNAISVAAGTNHSLALRSDGTVVAWGRTNENQCAVPSGLSNVLAIAAGGNQSLALFNSGTVTNWGATVGVIPANMTNVTAIAAGTNFCLALRSNGTVVGWGDNGVGQTNVPFSASNVVAIAAGDSHGLALRSDGHVISWGSVTNVPVDLTNVMAVAAGSGVSLALKNGGTVMTWTNAGQTNIPTLTKVIFEIAHEIQIRENRVPLLSSFISLCVF